MLGIDCRNRSFINSTVLVLGGSGGTGTTGIQLAKYFGASKIVTTTSSTNFKYCESSVQQGHRLSYNKLVESA